MYVNFGNCFLGMGFPRKDRLASTCHILSAPRGMAMATAGQTEPPSFFLNCNYKRPRHCESMLVSSLVYIFMFHPFAFGTKKCIHFKDRTYQRHRFRSPQGGPRSNRYKWIVIYMGVSKNSGTPKWMVKIMENPIKMDNLGVPLFLEAPIYIYIFNPDINGRK